MADKESLQTSSKHRRRYEEYLLGKGGEGKQEFHGLTQEGLHLLQIIAWKYFTSFRLFIHFHTRHKNLSNLKIVTEKKKKNNDSEKRVVFKKKRDG